ncbi:MAG: phosphoribosyltransferase family protein [Candidatus Bathyarchaeia archaeon]
MEPYVDINKSRVKPVPKQKVAAMLTGKKVLLVDDLGNTGKSLQVTKAHVLQQGAVEVRIATVCKKPENAVNPDYYEAKTSRWTVFP